MIYAWPPYPAGTISALLQGPAAFGANGAYSTVFQVARTGNIRTFHYATGAVTTGATLDVRAETVDAATGDPSGTLIAANTNASQVIANADDNVFFATTLTADAPVTAGEFIALVFKLPAGGGSMIFRAFQLGSGSNVPYGDQFQVSYAKQNNILCFAAEYSDGVVVPIQGILPPCTTQTSPNVNSGSSPNIYAQRFTVVKARRAVGVWTLFDADNDCAVRLVSTAYNSGAGTGIHATATIDPQIRRDGAQNLRLQYFDSATTYDLVAGTTYRLIAQPLTGSNITFNYYNTVSQLGLDAWGFGCLSTATDPTGDGDWTNLNSGTFAWALMGLLIDGDATGLAGSGGAFTFVG
jgi:hypothetical protein